MERGIRVENDAGIVVIGDGNRVVAAPVPEVRSAYREQVRRIAPPELVGRERELAELAEFCRADPGPAYAYWRADAWAGKTALMAWFALAPPPGVRIVPFFVTARLGAQNDVAAYTDVVLEQLAELAGEGLPALLTAATREAHLLRLYASAASACAARGERLVLLVDGLDEDRGVTTGADAHSIASLLPYDLRVIVSGRLNPPLPADVPENHPLRDPAVVRVLAPSPEARAIRVEAERELKHLLEAGGLPYDLLALVTAAGGGLTADDLVELTGAVPYRVKDVLQTGPGRTFARRGEAYLLAHEELVAGAREMLGERELARWRAVLYAWADRWRERGWPEGTPDYLLHGYVPMLRAEGDGERLVVCAVDERRHLRLLAATGGDAAALGEIGAAEDAVLGEADGADPVRSALRLAMGRSRLSRDSGSVPLALLEGWAAVGAPDRAVALARSLKGPRAIDGLCVVAGKLLDAGAPERAMELADEAERLAEALPADGFHGEPAATVTRLLGRLGAYDRAERLLRTITSTGARGARRALVDGLLAVGRYEQAVALGREEPEDGLGADVRAGIVEALVRAGHVAEAEREAYRQGNEPGARAVVLLRASVALREAGHRDAAGAALREAMVERTRMGPRRSGVFFSFLLDALVAAGEIAAAREDGDDGGAAVFASALIRNGRWEEALEVAGAMEGTEWVLVRARAARALALTGAVEQAMALAPEGEMPWEDPWPAIVSALLARGDLDAVAPLCGRLVDRPAWWWRGVGERSERVRALDAFLRRLVAEGAVGRARALVDGIEENTEALAVFAEVLYDAGHAAEARGMLAAEERRSRVPPRESLVKDLVALARALGEAGRRDDAAHLLRAVEGEPDLDPADTVPAALAAGRVEWAETLARGGSGFQQRILLPRVVAGYAAEGAFDRALRLVERPDAPPNLLPDAVAAFAEAGAWDRALDLASRRTWVPDVMEMCARMALESVRQGRPDEAREFLEAVHGLVTADLPVPLDAVRADYALGRNLRALFGADSLVRLRRPRVTELAMVLMGAYDEALDFFRSWNPGPVGHGLADLVAEYLRAARYGHAAALLGGMHHLGPACGEAYALLARAEPDPALARRWAVLALRLGNWRSVLPDVLAVDPGSVPLVLEEADRLRRALEV
ncbi:hypothetical protein OG462_26545 [Streptomyces sp. NBC_01077]|uniref:hypothetical protein n=1 Tax=Streptomyces sp. NBC_01077 TaxID=2903746 RepID=UPI003864FE72|nr:hypothetical protein OG462_26545 [Streptomyces sp. NBC_01077]